MKYDRATNYIGRTIYREAKRRRLIERLSDISFMPSGFLSLFVRVPDGTSQRFAGWCWK